MYLAVHEAYRVLKNPVTRGDYDLTLKTQSLAERMKAARMAQTLSK